MRIPLRDGMWAEMRDRITHGQDKEIKRAARRSEGEIDDLFGYWDLMVRTFVTEWNVNDPDGNSIPLTDADAVDRAPDDIIDVLFAHAVGHYKATTDPNPPTPPSSDS